MMEDRIVELKRHIEDIYTMMTNCHSDEAYRLYNTRLDEFISELTELESKRKS